MLEKTFPPLADDLPRHVQPLADLLVLKALRCQQDGLGADHRIIC